MTRPGHHSSCSSEHCPLVCADVVNRYLKWYNGEPSLVDQLGRGQPDLETVYLCQAFDPSRVMLSRALADASRAVSAECNTLGVDVVFRHALDAANGRRPPVRTL